MTVNGYDVVRMVRNLREPDVTPKTAARAADLMDELAEELAGHTRRAGRPQLAARCVEGPMSTKPIRGQRRRGTPSLVLPGDPDGCGWIAMGDGLYQACGVNVAPWRHLTRQHVRAQYVGRPTRWGNPAKVVDDGGLGVRYAVMVDGPGFCGGLYADRAAANTRAAWAYESSSRKWVKDEPIELARHLAPLVTADVLSCWCPLDAPCHGDTLCDLVGRLRSGDLVPGLVATLDVCGGALRIDGTEWAVAEIASNVDSCADAGMCRNDMVLQTAGTYSLDPELVRLAARVGGAL